MKRDKYYAVGKYNRKTQDVVNFDELKFFKTEESATQYYVDLISYYGVEILEKMAIFMIVNNRIKYVCGFSKYLDEVDIELFGVFVSEDMFS